MKIEKPFETGAAIASAATAITSVPSAWPAIRAIWQSTPITDGGIWLAVFAFSLALALAFGRAAIQGRTEAENLLEQIRARPKISLPSGHPAAPPPNFHKS